MNNLMLHASSMLCAFAGVAGLCFQVPEQRERFGFRPLSHTARSMLVTAALLALALSLAAALDADIASFALVAWICQAGAAALLLVLALPFRAPLLAAAAPLAGLAGLALYAGSHGV